MLFCMVTNPLTLAAMKLEHATVKNYGLTIRQCISAKLQIYKSCFLPSRSTESNGGKI